GFRRVHAREGIHGAGVVGRAVAGGTAPERILEALGRRLVVAALEVVAALLVARREEVYEPEVRGLSGWRREQDEEQPARPADGPAAPEPEPRDERQDRREIPAEVAVARALVLLHERLHVRLDPALDACDVGVVERDGRHERAGVVREGEQA